ncbi:hypothetical protein BU16DRAFT_539399 [Lophium mytilinum]|uniref:Uncharacterized protein n=1 Tax=Lophium mytilinum TaxID=390894 RepID=A0A6A6QUP0_9PEZI|nr:hypothetical protein BU16DRAFT_539399 [Lophium mytilinum]
MALPLPESRLGPRQGPLGRLPDELLLKVFEVLFHAINLDSGALNGVFDQVRQLLRTLVLRPGLQRKVKILRISIGDRVGVYKTADALGPIHTASILETMDNLHWGMLGGRSGPQADLFRKRIGGSGSIGALFALLPNLRSLELELVSMRRHDTLYHTLFGGFRVPLECIPAAENLRTLIIHQDVCNQIPWLEIESPSSQSFLTLKNLTRLELSHVTVEGLQCFATKRLSSDTLSKVKHLSLENPEFFGGFPSTDIRLQNFLLSFGSLVSFTLKDATVWASRRTVSYSDLLDYLSVSHESLESLTLVWPGRNARPPNTYAICSLSAFKRLRHVEIEQMALVGHPVNRSNKTWDVVNGVEAKLWPSSLRSRMPESLETLVVQSGVQEWESTHHIVHELSELDLVCIDLGGIVSRACEENIRDLRLRLEEDDIAGIYLDGEARGSLDDDENEDVEPQECDGDEVFIDADFALHDPEEIYDPDYPGSDCLQVDEPDEEYWQSGDRGYVDEEPDLIEVPNKNGSANLQKVVVKVNIRVQQIPPEAMRRWEQLAWRHFGVEVELQNFDP